MTNFDNISDQNPTHEIVPSRISGRMDQIMNSALAAERIIMTAEVRNHLNGILDLYNGQVYRELDTAIRQEVNTSLTRSALEGLQGEVSGETPRDLTQSVLGEERLIQTTIVERYEVIATTTARLISHIAASESTLLTRTDGRNGYSLTEGTLARVTTVLVNLTDYAAEEDGKTMTIINNLVTNSDLAPEDAVYILSLLDNNPNAFASALNGALDEVESHGNSRNFNEAGLLLSAMSNDQKEDLITLGLDSLNQSNNASRIQSIRQVALYGNLPIAVVEGLINAKIAALNSGDPLIITLTALRDGIVTSAPMVAEQYEQAMSRMAMNPDVFRITNPTSMSRVAGFAMSYWGAATVFANTFLALAQRKPGYILKNIGVTVVAGTVARIGGEMVSGNPNPLAGVFGSFVSGLALDSDNKEALRQRNWAQIINDNLLSEVGSEPLGLWADTRFIEILNSMGENTPEDQLIRFSTASFVEKLDRAGLGDRYRELYGDNFLDNPRLEETKLNLLANAYRGLGVRDNTTFMTYAALPFGLTNEDIQIA